MHAIWRGAVSFGLVYVPVKLYSATESHDVSFRQVHAEDGGRIRYRKVCSVDGEEVSREQIAKGYELENGEMIVLDDSDLADLPISTSREISVDSFVPAEQVDPLLFEKSYFLEPDKTGAKAYALLRAALKETDRVAVVSVTLRTRSTMALLRVHASPKGDVIVLQTLMWPDEVRVPDFSVEVEDAKPSEVAMAQMLVETLAGDFAPEHFTDDYSEAVQALVRAKVEGRALEPRSPDAGGDDAQVVDLMAALQKSVEAAKKARDDDAAHAPNEESTPAEPTPTAATKKPKKAAKKSARKPSDPSAKSA